MFHAAVFTGIFTGIDINDGQCFRRIDHQITTAFQPNLSGGRQIDLSFQAAELVERKQIIPDTDGVWKDSADRFLSDNVPESYKSEDRL